MSDAVCCDHYAICYAVFSSHNCFTIALYAVFSSHNSLFSQLLQCTMAASGPVKVCTMWCAHRTCHERRRQDEAMKQAEFQTPEEQQKSSRRAAEEQQNSSRPHSPPLAIGESSAILNSPIHF